jgi:hypothetical protein
MIDKALRQAVEIASYERAAANFTDLLGVGLSKSSLQRLVDEYGRAQVAREETEAQAMVAVPQEGEEVVQRERPEPDSEVMSVSCDGALINIREEGWKEVKLVSVSAVAQQPGEGDDEPKVQLTRHSYRAGLWDAKTFTNHHWAEACRRGLEKAKQVVCVSDGAVWIWLIAFICFPWRVEILDWWHAVQYLWQIAQAAFGSDDTAAKAWVKAQKQVLKTAGLRPVLQAVRILFPRSAGLPEPVVKAIGYFYHNRHRMHYRSYRQAGLPIGSGTVESACKTVVQARMKQAGMRWSRTGAQAMLSLRCLLLSQRWHELPLTAPT